MTPSFCFKLGKYVVKLAETEQEFDDTYRLRYESFYSHLSPPLNAERSDKNSYDKDAHLLIVKDGEQVVGTYRLRCSLYTDKFYATTTFDFSNFINALEGDSFVELTRACILPNKRQGAVILALWRGVLTYIEQAQVDYLFGCVSLINDSPAAALALFAYLNKHGHVVNSERRVLPLPARQILQTERNHYQGPKDLLPPLFASYLKMGTKVYSEPAYDCKLRGFDFFCALKLDELNSSYLKKFAKF